MTLIREKYYRETRPFISRINHCDIECDSYE